MSGIVYPMWLGGRMLTQHKTPTWNTHTQKALSGKESRISYRAYPLYEWELQYEFLNDNVSRVNFVPWSQDLTEWITSNGGQGLAPTVVGNYLGTVAPDGTYTASRVILNIETGTTSSDFAEVYAQAATSATTSGGTFSIWLRTNDGSTKVMTIGCGGINSAVTVTPVWTRYFVNFNAAIGASNEPAIALIGNTSGGAKYIDVSAWGAQVETGLVASLPIISTFGSAIATSDLQTLTGLMNQMMGQYDTFLYPDPDFNTVTQQEFATGNGTTTAFNLTVTYEPGNAYGSVAGLAGQPEWVQNTLGLPAIFTWRYGGPEMLGSSSRTNLVLQSNFAATWTASAATLTPNAATAPNGATMAALLTDSSANSLHCVQQTVAITAGSRYTVSVFLKHTNHQYVALAIDDTAANAIGVVIDLTNVAVSGVFLEGISYASNADVSVTSFGSGWMRVTLSWELKATDASARITLSFAQNLTTAPWLQTYAGSGSDTFQCWGAQLEVGTIATALIPTTTAAATDTGDYSLTTLTESGDVNTFQQVSFVTAPANGVVLTWSGTFLYRVRFSDDKNDFKEFLRRIWSADKIALEQVLI